MVTKSIKILLRILIFILIIFILTYFLEMMNQKSNILFFIGVAGTFSCVIAIAEGKAKANILLNNSLTPTLIEWERLQVSRETIIKWNGVRPTVEGNPNLLFTLPSK